MTDKQINKWLRRRFSQVGWVLVGYFVLLNALAMVTMLLESAEQLLWGMASGGYDLGLDMDAILGNASGYLMTVAVGLLLLYVWKGGEYWKHTLLARGKRMRPGVFACMVSFCIGAQMLNSIWLTALELVMNQFGSSLMPMLESVSGASDTFTMFLYSCLVAPIAEEVLFRGYVLRTLQPYGKRFAILGSAVLFGLFHGNLLQTPYALVMGLVLGYVAVEYALEWAVLLHLFNNLVLADLFTRLTENLPDMVFALVNYAVFGGFFLISLVILVKNRRKIRAYNRSEWMDRRVLKCFFTNSGILAVTAITVYSMLSLFAQ